MTLSETGTMDKREFRAAASLAAVFSVRLLGLFMIYPVFAVYARDLSGATAYKIGLALGIYGLSQGLLQIPFGILSDKIGRKILIVLGLTVFGIGSAVAAVSSSIDGVIIGRVLQGSGAVGSVILALVADLTSEENRTKAMAMVGITIGTSFMIALVVGPIVAGLAGIAGIFWLMAGLALLGIGITLFIVPSPSRLSLHRDAGTVPAMLGSVLKNTELLRLDFGIFALHAMLTASFLVVPGLLHEGLNVTSRSQWIVYLPVLLLSIIVMVPAIIVAEKYRCMKAVFVSAVGTLAASQIMLVFSGRDVYVQLAAITIFFAGFNIMEASLPSLITKTAPPDAKGTAAGVYSSSQFLGIFVGGAAGGWMHQNAGNAGVFILSAVLALLWLAAAVTMARPRYLTTHLVRISDAQAASAESLAGKLRQMPGVADAVVIAEEKLAYLKVDPKFFDAAKVEELTSAA
ncbi:MFS transporter [Nitrobacter sp. NHB1]|uniref:MFS transporter n=1 Tax=Nitrobacter sp. NHB1 TaxID=3119830 RepID=UPI002FFFFC4F